MITDIDRYQTVLGDQSLAVFVKKMKEFDQKFCDSMASGNEFTLKLEVRGVGGKMVHTRLYYDDLEKP